MNAQVWWRPALAEYLGTLTLIFVGAGSVVVSRKLVGDPGSGGALVGIALAHGLAIAVMITALGHLSGGHFNPAVTSAALFTRKIQPALGVLYILSQLLGGVTGAFLLVTSLPADWWNPPDVELGTPMVSPLLDPAKAVLLEAVLTFFLVLVVFGAAIDKRNPASAVGGLAIGLTISMGILLGGPLTGAALNPARAFGPALIAGSWDLQYVYWAGPILGGLIAGLVYDAAFLEPAKKAATPPPAGVESAPPPSVVPPPAP